MTSENVEILLAEDNPDHVELTLDALENNGVLNTVHVVSDGQAALDFLNKHGEYKDAPRPGLILLDINLPKISGLEVLKQVKSDPSLKTIPVVMLTTSGNDRDIQASYGNGANSYIVKPVDFKKFRQSIKELKMYWLISNRLPN